MTIRWPDNGDALHSLELRVLGVFLIIAFATTFLLAIALVVTDTALIIARKANLADEEYFTDKNFYNEAVIMGAVGAPRTYGIRFTWNWF